MPRAPIRSREVFYDKLRDGSIRLLDWALVDTSLGGMMEPLSLRLPRDKIVNVDAVDASYTRLTEFDEDRMATVMGTAGWLLPIDFSA